MKKLINRTHKLFDRIEALLPNTSKTHGLTTEAIAHRWQSSDQRMGQGAGQFLPVKQHHQLQLNDLIGIENQKQVLALNTQQFVHGYPCNNALLWGARGTGKSSLVKALLNEYAAQGLRLIEVDAHDLTNLIDIVTPLIGRPERYILFVDDLSFSEDDTSYRALKAVLDGSVAIAPDNVIIYATSNRRHLMPEPMKDNLEAQSVDGEIHPGESIEEKISLSERFGIWLSFQPFRQDDYIEITTHWLQQLGPYELTEEVRKAALQWALRRGSRSGRVAQQFAKDWAGQQQLIKQQGD